MWRWKTAALVINVVLLQSTILSSVAELLINVQNQVKKLVQQVRVIAHDPRIIGTSSHNLIICPFSLSARHFPLGWVRGFVFHTMIPCGCSTNGVSSWRYRPLNERMNRAISTGLQFNLTPFTRHTIRITAFTFTDNILPLPLMPTIHRY